MKERPILFSGPMVKALLSGAKTQTRRLVGLDTLQVSNTPGYDLTWRGRAPLRSIAQQRRHSGGCWQDVSTGRFLGLCPYGVPGDRLWVRETWASSRVHDTTRPSGLPMAAGEAPTTWYAADGTAEESWLNRGRWRPSIHMPRWASRITLEVTDVRVERLQDISEEDARAEGMDWAAPLVLPGERIDDDREDPREVGYGSGSFALQNFRKLWDSINGKRVPWATNPWVFAISFKRLSP